MSSDPRQTGSIGDPCMYLMDTRIVHTLGRGMRVMPTTMSHRGHSHFQTSSTRAKQYLSVCVYMYILICICASHLPSQPKKLDQLVSEFTVQALPNIDAFHTDLPTRYTNSGAPHLHELFSPLLNPHSA